MNAKQRGFTLVELLVVIAIIGVLVGLLLPAVQSTRESARRSRCSNNLKQIGLALHSFHDSKKRLPQACIPTGGSGGTMAGNMGWSWPVFVLPFMEYAEVYDRLKVQNGYPEWGTASPDTAKAPIPTFLCPGCKVGLLDPAAKIQAEMGWGAIASSKTNYLANGGPKWTYRGTSSSRQQASLGAIRKETGIKFSDVTDGLSKTLLIGEGGGTPATPGDEALMPSIWVCTTDMGSAMAQVLRYASDKINSGTRVAFGSTHPGGAQFGMCDGAVRFVTDQVEFIAGGMIWGADLDDPAQLPAQLADYVSPSKGVFQKLSARNDGNGVGEF
jgi:prepilin-type N-terminal cleavage/methylation domain-containing protein/prepilin-type processing-associated H-X9-DG protein